MITNLILTLYFYESFLLSIVVSFIMAVFIWPFSFLRPVLHKTLVLCGKFILFVSGSRLYLQNPRTYDARQTYLFVSNHQSLFDILVLFTLLDDIPFKWIIKKSLFYTPLFGFTLWAVDYINLDRENRYKAFRAIQKAISYIKKGVSILIFPEGTRSLDDTVNEFKSGSIVIAYHTGAKVVPIVLKNTLFIQKKKSAFINPLPIKVRFL
ncbi:MAG: lysophospholipid acyltransferase family protein [bacterium]|nr:lysophospholipid acyltransferase family protein [bacterium]